MFVFQLIFFCIVRYLLWLFYWLIYSFFIFLISLFHLISLRRKIFNIIFDLISLLSPSIFLLLFSVLSFCLLRISFLHKWISFTFLFVHFYSTQRTNYIWIINIARTRKKTRKIISYFIFLLIINTILSLIVQWNQLNKVLPHPPTHHHHHKHEKDFKDV